MSRLDIRHFTIEVIARSSFAVGLSLVHDAASLSGSVQQVDPRVSVSALRFRFHRALRDRCAVLPAKLAGA